MKLLHVSFFLLLSIEAYASNRHTPVLKYGVVNLQTRSQSEFFPIFTAEYYYILLNEGVVGLSATGGGSSDNSLIFERFKLYIGFVGQNRNSVFTILAVSNDKFLSDEDSIHTFGILHYRYSNYIGETNLLYMVEIRPNIHDVKDPDRGRETAGFGIGFSSGLGLRVNDHFMIEMEGFYEKIMSDFTISGANLGLRFQF
jgi:hypothetical protein